MQYVGAPEAWLQAYPSGTQQLGCSSSCSSMTCLQPLDCVPAPPETDTSARGSDTSSSNASPISSSWCVLGGMVGGDGLAGSTAQVSWRAHGCTPGRAPGGMLGRAPGGEGRSPALSANQAGTLQAHL